MKSKITIVMGWLSALAYGEAHAQYGNMMNGGGMWGSRGMGGYGGHWVPLLLVVVVGAVVWAVVQKRKRLRWAVLPAPGWTSGESKAATKQPPLTISHSANLPCASASLDRIRSDDDSTRSAEPRLVCSPHPRSKLQR